MALFVLGADGENKELKAAHVPGPEVSLTSTSLSLKYKHPVIHARSFSLFGSVLDVPEFECTYTLFGC